MQLADMLLYMRDRTEDYTGQNTWSDENLENLLYDAIYDYYERTRSHIEVLELNSEESLPENIIDVRGVKAGGRVLERATCPTEVTASSYYLTLDYPPRVQLLEPRDVVVEAVTYPALENVPDTKRSALAYHMLTRCFEKLDQEQRAQYYLMRYEEEVSKADTSALFNHENNKHRSTKVIF